MTWPALYNGFPLMYPDTLDYVKAGRPVALALLRHRRSSYYGLRSLIYSLGILPFHLGGTIWPIIAMQCLLTSFVLWMVVRSIVPNKTASRFLVLMLFLSLFSSLSWHGSYAMPDILGPDLYLCVYLLVFARNTLSRIERWAVYLIAWWAIDSHASHLPIVLCLCLLLALLAMFRSKPLRSYLRIAGELTAILALAIGAQLALNTFLYGKSSLNGTRPPFLTARLVADGPGRWYLQNDCGVPKWEMCKYVNRLSDPSGTTNRFLWAADGVWMSATVDSQQRILRQDTPFAIAVLRTYPVAQFEKSAANFFRQLTSFRLEDLGRHSVVVDHIGEVLPKAQWQYFESRQAHNQLPASLFTSIQYGVVVLSFLSLFAFLPWLWRSRPPRLLRIGLVILSTVTINALFTSTLSMVASRYESRVIWLVPFLAALCALTWYESRSFAVSPLPES